MISSEYRSALFRMGVGKGGVHREFQEDGSKSLEVLVTAECQRRIAEV